jgi:osmotically-inducible protein OsmY
MAPNSEYASATLPLRLQAGPEWHESDFPEVVEAEVRDCGALRSYAKAIHAEMEDGTLTLTGTLPSYYLKQMLQTVVQRVPGVLHIRNQVEVANDYVLGAIGTRRRELIHD